MRRCVHPLRSEAISVAASRPTSILFRSFIQMQFRARLKEPSSSIPSSCLKPRRQALSRESRPSRRKRIEILASELWTEIKSAAVSPDLYPAWSLHVSSEIPAKSLSNSVGLDFRRHESPIAEFPRGDRSLSRTLGASERKKQPPEPWGLFPEGARLFNFCPNPGVSDDMGHFFVRTEYSKIRGSPLMSQTWVIGRLEVGSLKFATLSLPTFDEKMYLLENWWEKKLFKSLKGSAGSIGDATRSFERFEETLCFSLMSSACIWVLVRVISVGYPV